MKAKPIYSIVDEIDAMEDALHEAGYSIAALCRRAQIRESTWQRWKKSAHRPQLDTWYRACDAFEEMVNAPA